MIEVRLLQHFIDANSFFLCFDIDRSLRNIGMNELILFENTPLNKRSLEFESICDCLAYKKSFPFWIQNKFSIDDN